MIICLHISKKNCTFAAKFKKHIKHTNMNTYLNTFLKNLGVIIVLLGVACFVVYFFGKQNNILLAAGLGVKFVGIVTHIILNKVLD